MQGSGTSANPYIPENFSEFITAVGSSGKYVTLPENTVYDFAEIEVNSTIQIKCVCLDGNWAIFKNIETPAGWHFFETINADCVIRKISFRSFKQNSDYSLFYINTINDLYFESCDFVGSAKKGSIFFVADRAYNFTFRSDTKTPLGGGCYFEVDISDSGSLVSGAHGCVFEYCYMFVNVNINADAEPFKAVIFQSYIEGSVNTLNNSGEIDISATRSVVDLFISEGHTVNWGGGGYSTINASKCKGTINASAPVYMPIQADEAQIRKDTYLRQGHFLI